MCLSSFYKECVEFADSELDSSCTPEADRRSVSPVTSILASDWTFLHPCACLILRPDVQGSAGRNKAVDENYNNVSSPSRGGLAGKLQQLLTPTKHRASVRRAASVGDRRPGGGGGAGGGVIGRRVSDQRPSRKGQVAETLLKAKEKLVNATSEVTAAASRLLVRSDSLWRKDFTSVGSMLFLLPAGVNRVCH